MPTDRSPASRRRVTRHVSEELRSSTPKVSVAGGLASPIDPTRAGSLSTILDETRTEQPAGTVAMQPSRQLPFVAPAVGRLRPKTPVVSGFDRLDFSIAQLVDKLPAAPLEDKFNVVAEWVERFNVDVTPARTTRVIMDLLDSAEERVEGSAKQGSGRIAVLGSTAPLVARSMASLFSVHQLMLVVCRLHPMLTTTCERVMRHLLGAVYVAPAVSLPSTIVDPGDDEAVLRLHLQPFKGRMHLQANHESSKRLTALEQFVFSQDESTARQKRVLQKAVRAWQSSTVRLNLRAWRREVVDARAKKEADRERSSMATEIERLRAEVSSLRISKANVEEKLSEATQENSELKVRITTLEQQRTVDAERHDKVITARDILIEDLEQQVERLRAEIVDASNAAETRYRELGDAVAGFVNEQAALTGVGQLSAARRMVLKTLDQGESDFDAAGGGQEHVIEWVKLMMRSADPEEAFPRPAAIMASPQCLNCFAVLAKSLFAHLTDAMVHVEQALEANSVTQKGACVLDWARAAGFLVPAHVSPEALIRSSREGTSVMMGLFLNLMASVTRPFDCFTAALPENFETLPVASIPASDEPPLGPDEACTYLRQYIYELRSGGSAAIKLLRAAWCQASTALSLNAGGGQRQTALSADEEADKTAFQLNHQLIADVASREDVEPLQELVDTHYRQLRKTFLFYAGDDGTCLGQLATISPAAVYQMVYDCRLVVPGSIDKESVTTTFAFNALDSRRWLACLVKLASARFSRESNIAVAFKTLLEAHLLAFGQVPDLTLLPRATKEDAPLAALISEYRGDLFKIFRAYCRDPSNTNKLMMDHFIALLQDGGILGNEVSEATAKRIFNLMKAKAADEGMGFDAFISCISWCSAFLFRDPFERAAVKIKRTIFGTLLPAFQYKFKLAFVPAEE